MLSQKIKVSQVQILILLIFFNSILCSFNETEENINNIDSNLNETKINDGKIGAIYAQFAKCEGHFSRIQFDVIDQNSDYNCDHFWTHEVNVTSNGYYNNVRHSLDTISLLNVKDFNGDEDYNFKGPILSGECNGAQVIVHADLKANKGNCDSGVTELYSKNHWALIALKGVCETTCNGTIWVHYWPGKFKKRIK